MKRFKKEEMQILELGTRFQMLHLISIEDVRAWLCLFFFFFFSSGEDVEIQHVCSCVLYAQRGSEFFDL